MGYIGYYIKKDNILSIIILLPMLVLLSIIGLGFFNSTLSNFPQHLLSCIFCFAAIGVIIIGVLKKKKNRIITFAIVTIFTILYFLISNGILFDNYKEYESYEDLNEYGITLSEDYYISGFISTKQGSAQIIIKDEKYVLKLTGMKNTTYKFTVSGNDKQIRFEYYYDENGNLILKQDADFN